MKKKINKVFSVVFLLFLMVTLLSWLDMRPAYLSGNPEQFFIVFMAVLFSICVVAVSAIGYVLTKERKDS